MAHRSGTGRRRTTPATVPHLPRMTPQERAELVREMRREQERVRRERRQEAKREQRRKAIRQAEVRALRAGVKVGWRLRRQLLPVAVMLGTYLAGWLLYGFHPAVWIVFGVGAVGTYGWWVAGATYQVPRTGYLVVCLHAITLWVSVAAGRGVEPPMPAWLAGVGGALSLPYWWRQRIQVERPALPAKKQPEPEQPALEGETPDDRVTMWRAKVACSNGPLDHSHLKDLEDITGGWVATIKLLRGNTDRAVMATRDIGAALGLRAGSIVIEPTATGELDEARIMVLPNNPLREVVRWTRPTLNPETGVSVLGYYADLAPVKYRHYRPGSGPVHTLISGSTDSGKSRTVEQLLAEERHSGVVVSWVIDPQGGASLPDWQDSVPVYARNIDQARVVLLRARARMYARNGFMSQILWTDNKGRTRKGLGQFTPMDPRHGLPLLSITIDEAQTVLADRWCCELVEEMIGMSRKCGIKFRLITQVPLLDSLGNSMKIRDAVAAGNVIVLRTANRLTGQVAFNGSLPVDPCSLPKEWPDGSTTSGLGFVFAPGADRPSTMRVGLIDDPFGWATSGTPAEIEPYDDDEAIRPILESWGTDMINSGVPPATPAAGPPGRYGQQPQQPAPPDGDADGDADGEVEPYDAADDEPGTARAAGPGPAGPAGAATPPDRRPDWSGYGKGEQVVLMYLHHLREQYTLGARDTDEADRGTIIGAIQTELMGLGQETPGLRTLDKALRDLSQPGGPVECVRRGVYRLNVGGDTAADSSGSPAK